MIPLKSEADLAALKEAGSIAGLILRQLRGQVKAGMATLEIDRLAEELVRRAGAECAFLGYRGYPAATCVSVNEEIVHGIPGGRVMRAGDIVSIDLGVRYRGYFSDAALTVAVGKLESRVKKLLQAAKEALERGIKAARPGNHLSDISHAIQSRVEQDGFSVVRQFVGHGIGKGLHEEPEIPNFGQPGKGPVLEKGMVLAIEPMVNMGTWECEILDNGWTAVTKDRLPSAHFEHTVAVTEDGPEILTL